MYKHSPAQARAKWYAALRSGEYRQGHGLLSPIEDGVVRHCCLGVACQVMLQEEPGFLQVADDIVNLRYVQVSDSLDEEYVLPPIVQEWLGLPDQNPEISCGEEAAANAEMREGSLSAYCGALNDCGKYDFHAIADFLQRHFDPEVSDESHA